ncbi:ubiquinol oxidase subunit II [Pandoraea sp.]|uniref:ubiquinol oxidase subunit II n=1 Tax=Pandoraea sp. TaxID=1883445 RepID=UPI0012006804|nr:ubiquinol oxidase subunit II [Pandoraea sp.]TAL55961.1 MAG: ubiquinol oxidase subunit II [Pandoraea sp.]TAM20698.1 MAG: ubiquinol oxidase subunit II [Pandoraea sp.]
MKNDITRKFLTALSACAALLLGGCDNLTLLNPKGQIGADEKSIIITATVLMLLVVVPVIIMTFAFAWKYRASNKQAKFDPKWSHSTKIEMVVWLVPCAIIAVLAVITWNTSHTLDPYRPLDSDVKPVRIEAVAMDWKWLFIYPDLHIATVNQIAVPVNTPINFQITSDSVMNSFFIPQLGSQVYAMAGMETKLHLIANHVGTYDGISANFSGDGFSDMKFTTLAKSDSDFEAWVKQVKASPTQLDTNAYKALAKPSQNNPVTFYSSVNPQLYHDILAQYRDGGADAGKAMTMTAPDTEKQAQSGAHMDMNMNMNVAMHSSTKE